MVQIKDLPLPVTRIWLPSLNAKNLSETFSSSQRRPTFAFEMCLTGQGMSRVFLREDGKYHLSAFYIVTCPVYIWLHFSLHSSFLCVMIPFLISLQNCNVKKKKKKSCVTVNSSGCSVQCLRNITQQFCNAALTKGPLPIEQKHKCFLLVLSRTFMALGGPSMALL